MTGSYTQVFGGNPIQEANVSYSLINLTSSISLSWPSTYFNRTNVVPIIMDVNATVAAQTITLPDATEVSVGTTILISSIGTESFTVLNNAGGTLQVCATSTIYFFYLKTNSTAAGTWGLVTFGATSSGASAAALAGLGLNALLGVLNINTTAETKTSDYLLVASDRASLKVWTGGTGTFTLPQAATVGVGNGYVVMVSNQSTTNGALTVATSGGDLIDGEATSLYAVGETSLVISDGISAWYTVGKGIQTFFSVNVNNKSLAAQTGNITLTTAEAQKLIQNYSGAPAGNITISVPASPNEYIFVNNTTGAFQLFVQMTADPNPAQAIAKNERLSFYCDGVSLYSYPTSISGVVITFPNGTAAAPSVTFTSDTTTGLYLSAVGTLGLAAGGIAGLTMTSTVTTSLNDFVVTPITTNSIALNPYGAAAGNTANLQFRELTANGTNYIALKAPDAITTNATYTLPILPTVTGQVLSSTTAGVMSWPTSLTTAASTVNVLNTLNVGASGAAGTINIFPATAALGQLSITTSNNAGNTTTNVNAAAQSGARTYTIPDAGASASFVMTEGTQTINGSKSFGSTVNTDGSFAATAIGGGLQVKTGANSRIGTVTLGGGTGVGVVSNTSVTANTFVFISPVTIAGTPGDITITKSAGVSFTLQSDDAGDTSTYAWILVESIP